MATLNAVENQTTHGQETGTPCPHVSIRIDGGGDRCNDCGAFRPYGQDAWVSFTHPVLKFRPTLPDQSGAVGTDDALTTLVLRYGGLMQTGQMDEAAAVFVTLTTAVGELRAGAQDRDRISRLPKEDDTIALVPIARELLPTLGEWSRPVKFRTEPRDGTTMLVLQDLRDLEAAGDRVEGLRMFACAITTRTGDGYEETFERDNDPDEPFGEWLDFVIATTKANHEDERLAARQPHPEGQDPQPARLAGDAQGVR